MPRVLRARHGTPARNLGHATRHDSALCFPGTLTLMSRRPPRIHTSLLTRNPPTDFIDDMGTDRVYRARMGDLLLDRYCVRAGLGFGGFGTVVEAEDKITGTVVAVKLLHQDEDLQEDVHLEQRTYKRLIDGCDPHVNLFAKVIGSGNHEGFHCIVFELCHATLYDVMKGFSGLAPLPGRHVLEMSYQILAAISYLHSLGIIHTDLKPDNIAIKFPDVTSVRWLDPLTGFHDKKILVTAQICVLDLGTVVDANPAGNTGRCGTKQYRAPEMVLGLPWSYGIDSFAIGCVIAEIYLSDTLMSCDIDTDQEQLAAIDILFGPFPEEYARRIEDRCPGTFSIGGSNVAVKFPAGGDVVSARERLEGSRRLECLRPIAARVHHGALCDLIRRITHPNPDQRLQPSEAVKHRYFDALRTLQLG